MKATILACAAALTGAGALMAAPAIAAPHFSGGGGHFAGHVGHAGPAFSGRTAGAWGGHGWGGHGFGDHHHFFGGFFFAPGFGFWDPFYWDVGFYAGYPVVPYWYDDNYDGYGPPSDGAGPNAAPATPSGYNCDGWRWDAQAQRYVPAKVACN